MSYVHYDGKDVNGNDVYDVTLIECVNCEKGKKYENYDGKELRGVSRADYRTLINSDDYIQQIKAGKDLYTDGIAGDTRCKNAYVKKKEDPIVGGSLFTVDYRFEYVGSCGTENINDTDFPFAYNESTEMTWEQYFKHYVYTESISGKTYYITKEMIEKGSLRFYPTHGLGEGNSCFSETEYIFNNGWNYPVKKNNNDEKKATQLTLKKLAEGDEEDVDEIEDIQCSDDSYNCISAVVQLKDVIKPMSQGVYRYGCYSNESCPM
jgi:hypothetical protein